MSTINIAVDEIKSLLEDIKAERDDIDRQISVLKQKGSELDEEASFATRTLYTLQKRHSLVTEAAPEVDVTILEGATTQEEGLILVANSRPNKRIKAADGWPYLIAKGLMKPMPKQKAYVNTYSILSRSKHFELVEPGVFELLDGDFLSPHSENQDTFSNNRYSRSGTSRTRERINAIAAEAAKNQGFIRHKYAVKALENAGIPGMPKLHALNILSKSGRFQKISRGLYKDLEFAPVEQDSHEQRQTEPREILVPTVGNGTTQVIEGLFPSIPQ